MGFFDALKKMVGSNSDDDDADDAPGEDIHARIAREHVEEYKAHSSNRRAAHARGRNYFTQVPPMHGIGGDQYLRLMAEIGWDTTGGTDAILARYGITMPQLQQLMPYFGGHVTTGGQGASEYYSLESDRLILELCQSRYRDHALYAWKCRFAGEVVAGDPPVTLDEFARIRKGEISPGTYSRDDVKCLETYWDTRRDCDRADLERLIKLDA